MQQNLIASFILFQLNRLQKSEDCDMPIFNNNYEKGFCSSIGESTFDARRHVVNKKKKPGIIYQGNPDLQPVRTYEVRHLVNFFNKLSQQLNEKVLAIIIIFKSVIIIYIFFLSCIY